jgi:hypothetical protein
MPEQPPLRKIRKEPVAVAESVLHTANRLTSHGPGEYQMGRYTV